MLAELTIPTSGRDQSGPYDITIALGLDIYINIAYNKRNILPILCNHKPLANRRDTND